jgi:hypothetical protein
MRNLLALGVFFFSSFSWGIPCDCEVVIYSPLTGSHRQRPTSLKTYQLEEFTSYSAKAQRACKESCESTFSKDMTTDRLQGLLLSYSQKLIAEKMVGHNCTGLTTLKYPVRVKAALGGMGLGNVADFIQVVNYEELCFY